MALLLDWALIIFGSLILVCAYRKIIYVRNASISNYIVALLYITCVLPIFLNYAAGIPEYNTVFWYKPFISPMRNETVSVIYDIYVLITTALVFFTQRKSKKLPELRGENSLTYLFYKNRIISIIIVLLPVFYIVFSGHTENFLVYAAAEARGLTDENRMPLMTPLMLLSMFTFFGVVFKGKMNRRRIAAIIVYSFILVWISGKRFMAANILIVIFFYTVNRISSLKAKRILLFIIPAAGVLLLLFSGLYLVVIKPLSDTSLGSVYEMLRVDFGRDDVIKYVIDKEILKGERILEYRGETFIGLLASFIPRAVWSAKPYPHYMYLTASILSVGIFDLPAGTTPSLMEMTICNFGAAGFAAAPVMLILLARAGDRVKDIDSKAIVLILCVVLLTQSMDVYLIAVALLCLMSLVSKLAHNKRLSFTLGKTR